VRSASVEGLGMLRHSLPMSTWMATLQLMFPRADRAEFIAQWFGVLALNEVCGMVVPKP